MAAGIQQLTVLTDIPTFAGIPRGNEDFVPTVDVRTFLRSLETYFTTNNIVTDEKKLQILYSKIDKEKGDAILILTSYAGEDTVPFEEIKNELLEYYPAFKFTDLKHAAEAYLANDLTEKDIACSLTTLENTSKAAALAYLAHEPLTKGEFDKRTMVQKYSVAGTTTTTATTTTGGSSGSSTTTTATTTTAGGSSGSPSTTAGTQTQPSTIPLLRILQNSYMHFFLSTQVPQKIYDRYISTMGPQGSSTAIIAKTTSHMKKRQLEKVPQKQKSKTKSRDEVIWKTTAQPAKPTQTKKQEQYSCYNCGKAGHMKKDCKSCGYCTKFGHKTKECKLRIAQAKGKYCSHCKIKDSHDTKECRKTAANVRMLHRHSEEDGSEQYDSHIHEENGNTSEDGEQY